MIESLSRAQQMPAYPVRLKAAAQKFEAAFLSQMLAAAGAGKPAGSFSGGVGEEQFASFLLDMQSQQIARAGGLGIAETIIRHYQPSVPEHGT